MRFYWLILGILSVWRITHLLYGEDGPWHLFVRLRRRLGDGFWGELLDCFYCLSIWIAVPFAFLLGADWTERLLLLSALSAGAIMLERLTTPQPGPPEASYVEDEGEKDVMLRRQEKTTSPEGSESTSRRVA